MPHGWLGVQVDGPLTEPGNPFAGEWDLMASSGVETVRVAFDWRAAQPVEGGPISFAAIRRRRGGRGGAADARCCRWCTGRRTGRRPRPGHGAAATPRGTAAYTQFLTALVGRYGPSGSLWAEQPGLPRMPIRDWQIWNEPNLTLLLVLAAVREAPTCGC